MCNLIKQEFEIVFQKVLLKKNQFSILILKCFKHSGKCSVCHIIFFSVFSCFTLQVFRVNGKPMMCYSCFHFGQARKVLEETKRNAELHHAQCNFKKRPGHMYYLYRRNDGSTYFSMLSEEVTKTFV